jgi:outer membrane protein TolC
VLLLQEKDNLLNAKKEQLQVKLKEVKSGIKNGVLLPTSDKTLEAELLKINQQFLEIDLNKTTLIENLSLLIGKTLSTKVHFQDPIITTVSNSTISRPELDLFQLKKEEIESSEQLLSKKNSPKLMGFANGGYGNPGLNMLDNSFQAFYTVGVKLNWKVFDWNANKKKRESLAINKDIIDNETVLFELNTTMELNQQQSEIEKLSGFITSDLEIIQLRKEVLQSAESQLRNGVITSSAYITELTNLYKDQNNLSAHEIQLLLVMANYNITKGQ